MSEHRQLAVIMFADIANYTALMQQNEAVAIQLIHRFKESLYTKVKDSKGDVIQYYGDGCLSVFTSAAHAIDCAKSLQEEFRNEPEVPVRIGIHLGDIVFR